MTEARATARPIVGDAMHPGVINTPPQTPLQEVAAQMASNRVHCMVVEGLARGRDRREELVWGIVSDLDLIKALASGGEDASAGDIAATEIVTVETGESVERAMQLMAEHECTHLVVVSARGGEPVGVISSLDVAAAMTDALERAS
jgi:CBS domain-containing protein